MDSIEIPALDEAELKKLAERIHYGTHHHPGGLYLAMQVVRAAYDLGRKRKDDVRPA